MGRRLRITLFVPQELGTNYLKAKLYWEVIGFIPGRPGVNWPGIWVPQKLNLGGLLRVKGGKGLDFKGSGPVALLGGKKGI